MKFPNKTDLEKVKIETKCLFMAVPINIYDVFMSHPMITSSYVVNPITMKYEILDSDEKVKRYSEDYLKYIDNCDSLVKVYMLVRNPYKMLWFKLNQNNLSAKDYADYLADAWVAEDNPNMDVNVTRKESLSYFKRAKKEILMQSKEDYKHWENLPDQVDIYRGVGIDREPYGLSWTDNLYKALWFMHRFDRQNKKGFLLSAKVPKNHIVAYFNTRGEEECLTDVFKAKANKLIHEITDEELDALMKERGLK